MPNLNRLADQACVFDRAYVTQPVCTPSRSSLLTGLYPHNNGCTANNCRSSDPDSVRGLTARYWGLCSQVDTHCGAILDTLQACGLWDKTIIVFTSDHGDMMGSHQLIAKCLMYEEAVRVPMLIKLPGRRRPCRIDGPVSQVDLMPTILDLMGVDPPDGLDGCSRAGLLASTSSRLCEDVVIGWNGGNNGVGPDDPNRVALPDEGTCLASAERRMAAFQDPVRTLISRDGRWKLNVSPWLHEHELFDLQTDPGECDNRYGDPALAGLTATLFERLRQWQRRTHDPVEVQAS